MTINRTYIHDSIISTLEMRDALDEGGKVDAADAAQVLADRLWAITRPRAVQLRPQLPPLTARRSGLQQTRTPRPPTPKTPVIHSRGCDSLEMPGVRRSDGRTNEPENVR